MDGSDFFDATPSRPFESSWSREHWLGAIVKFLPLRGETTGKWRLDRMNSPPPNLTVDLE